MSTLRQHQGPIIRLRRAGGVSALAGVMQGRGLGILICVDKPVESPLIGGEEGPGGIGIRLVCLVRGPLRRWELPGT